MPEPQNGAEILARIKPRLMEDWVGICLRPDLVAAFEEADADLLASKVEDSKRPSTVGAAKDSPETRKKAQAVKKLQDAMAAAEVKFWFRAKTRDAFRALCDEHPPRNDDQYDAFVGYNRMTVSDVLVRDCLFDPVFDDDSWEQLLDVVGAGQWNLLRECAEKVNGAAIQQAPFSVTASQVLAPLVSD